MKGFCEVTCGRCSCPPVSRPSQEKPAGAAAPASDPDPRREEGEERGPDQADLEDAVDAAATSEESLLEDEEEDLLPEVAGTQAPGVSEFLPCSLEESSIMTLLGSVAGTSKTRRALQLAGVADQLNQTNVQVGRACWEQAIQGRLHQKAMKLLA